MVSESMVTCIEVLYELKKIDETKKKMLLRGVREKNHAVYIEITNLLTLVERED